MTICIRVVTAFSPNQLQAFERIGLKWKKEKYRIKLYLIELRYFVNYVYSVILNDIFSVFKLIARDKNFKLMKFLSIVIYFRVYNFRNLSLRTVNRGLSSRKAYCRDAWTHRLF